MTHWTVRRYPTAVAAFAVLTAARAHRRPGRLNSPAATATAREVPGYRAHRHTLPVIAAASTCGMTAASTRGRPAPAGSGPGQRSQS
jgi:hypothetical protein